MLLQMKRNFKSYKLGIIYFPNLLTQRNLD